MVIENTGIEDRRERVGLRVVIENTRALMNKIYHYSRLNVTR